jgi:hypothetical protein
MHAAVAQRRIRNAQVWAVVLVVGGLALLWVPTSWIRSTPEAPTPAPVPTNRLSGQQVAMADVLPSGELAGMLNRVVPPQKSPIPPPPPTPPPGETDTTPAPPPPKPVMAIRMLSAIIGRGVGPDGQDRRRAIVSVDGQQLIASPGDVIAGKEGAPDWVKLTEVHTDHLMIEKAGGVTERLALTIPVDRPVMILPQGNPANVNGGMPNPGGIPPGAPGGRALGQNFPPNPPNANRNQPMQPNPAATPEDMRAMRDKLRLKGKATEPENGEEEPKQ